MNPLWKHEHPELPCYYVGKTDATMFEAAMHAMRWNKIATASVAGDNKGPCLKVTWQHRSLLSLFAEAIYTNYPKDILRVKTAYIRGDYSVINNGNQKQKYLERSREVVSYKHKYTKESVERFPLNQYINDLGYGVDDIIQ